ncbi:hypothetical protein [Brochothrix thermosphacta]|uniref:hypothetical protein n=1 Tax=Brochothrix thermosphacta TaxID=2756 RepID=UPI00265C996B|nr:hypothetical protein [Brochothrix thermosphacta]WKK68310.1 hypothetical protein Q0G00_08280 [Brochothrix thermosphacta]
MITINPQEYKIPLATKKGWSIGLGYVAKVNDYDLTIVPFRVGTEINLQISDLKTGVGIMRMPMHILEFMPCDTKEKMLNMYSVVLMDVEEILEKQNYSELREKLDKRLAELLFGPIPKIEKEVTE